MHAIVLGEWHSTRSKGDTLLLAGTRAEARLLNRHARQLLAAAGDLSLEGEIELAGRSFAVGDQVVMCHNDRHRHLTTGETFAVDNGMRGVTDPPRPHQRFLRPLRQIIESVDQTPKAQLDLERHGGRTRPGVCARVLQRLLALTAAIWHNETSSQPGPARSLLAYDH